MISIYTGTPGSGKSLHVADNIRIQAEIKGKLTVCNFCINCDMLRSRGRGQIICVKNNQIKESTLKKLAEKYQDKIGRKLKESDILLVIDEAQLIFNARDWQRPERSKWISFFSQHRKLGYDIILIAQDEEMIDKQIRSLIEYKIEHRKVKNISIGGEIINLLAGGGLHIWVKRYCNIGNKIESGFFKGNKKLYSMYDTYSTFD